MPTALHLFRAGSSCLTSHPLLLSPPPLLVALPARAHSPYVPARHPYAAPARHPRSRAVRPPRHPRRPRLGSRSPSCGQGTCGARWTRWRGRLVAGDLPSGPAVLLACTYLSARDLCASRVLGASTAGGVVSRRRRQRESTTRQSQADVSLIAGSLQIRQLPAFDRVTSTTSMAATTAALEYASHAPEPLAYPSLAPHLLLPSSEPDYLRLILSSKVYEILKETPLVFAPNLSTKLGNQIWLKREDLQEVFSFKIRGAYNFMANIPEQDRWKGVVTCSAG